ncbi:MAG: hypothetical protein HYT62_02440 [Candidatus Yanofskybacteria bacterium]|nr:hypothetical protein [Candidatus Yanofskybacteria bacterium]
MRAILVRFNPGSKTMFRGNAVVIPEADYLTITKGRGNVLVAKYASEEILKRHAKILKDIEIPFTTLCQAVSLNRLHSMLTSLTDEYVASSKDLSDSLTNLSGTSLF